ncbi:MAG: ATP-dependent nuclease [Thermoprotei archaeon]
MRITDFYVANFRSLKEVRLSDLGGVNLVVGYNGNGKTNLLSAIFTFVRNLSSGIERKTIDDPEGSYAVLWHTYDVSKPIYLGGTVYFSEDEVAKVLGKRTAYRVEVVNKVQYDRKTITWSVERLLVNSSPIDSDTLRDVKQLFSYAANLVEYVPIYDANYFDESLKRMMELYKSPLHLKKLWYDFANLVSSTIPEVKGLEIWEGNKLVLNVQNLPVYVDLAASGFQRAILMLFVIWASGNKVMLIEEPEVNMHPSLQARIIKLIKEWSKRSNFQVFITSHSPYFVSAKVVESVILMKRRDASSTAIQVNLDSTLELLLSILRVRLTDLLFNRVVILTGPQVEPVVMLNWLRRVGIPVDELGIAAFKVNNEYEFGLWRRVIERLKLTTVYVGLCDLVTGEEKDWCVPFNRNVEEFFSRDVLPTVLKSLGIHLEDKEVRDLYKSDVTSWLNQVTRKRGVDYERIRTSLGDIMSSNDTAELPKEIEILANKIKSIQEIA